MTVADRGPESLQVNVSLYGVIRDITRQTRFTISVSPKASVKDLLDHLAGMHPEKLRERLFDGRGELRKNVKVFVDGEPISGAMEKVSADGRVMQEVRVIVLAAAAGG